MDEIRLEILKFSYWEHFKLAKDLALILPMGHPRRVEVEEEINRIQEEISKLDSTKHT